MSCCSGRSRGVGAILAASFMLLILVMGFSVFLVMQGQTGEYQESVETMNTLDWARSQESLVIEGRPLSNLTASNELNMTVTHNGGVEARILYVGILDGLWLNYTYLEPCVFPCGVSGPILVNPGESVSNVSAFDSSVSSAFALSNVTGVDVHLITERGNIIKASIREGEFFGTGEGPGGQGGDGGGVGGGGGFPYTLFLDLSANYYSLISGSTENVFYVYATNLSQLQMDLDNLTLTVITDINAPPASKQNGFDADPLGTTDDQAIIIEVLGTNQSCDNVPITRRGYDGPGDDVYYYDIDLPGGGCGIDTLPFNGVLFIRIEGSHWNTNNGAVCQIQVSANGRVLLEGGDTEEVTSNVAVVTVTA